MSGYIPQELNDVDSAAFGEENAPSFGDVNTNFLQSQYDRLKMGDSGVDFKDWSNNIYDFSRKTRTMESDNNPKARASDLHGEGFSAAGVYQFTDASVKTGKNRLGNMGYDQKYIDSVSDDATEWDDDQSDAMFLGNLFAQKGSDEPISEMGKGSEGMDWDVYSKFHHTDPDEATVTRGKDVFGDYAGI